MSRFIPTELLAVSVMFLLSLFGSYVLFKLLKSSALIKKAGYQAGGALAGFLLIYSALDLTYLSALRQSQEAMERWTVTGTVQREDNGNHRDIEVRVLPPLAQATSQPSGRFRLENVVSMAGDLPEIQFYSRGYYDVDLRLAEEIADIDYGNRRIELKETILLTPEQGDEGIVEGAFQPSAPSPAGL